MVVAVKLENKKIFQTARDRLLDGMGTTVAAVQFDPEDSKGLIHICHVGDSRVYRIRDERIEQLTQDHSLLNDTLQKGGMSEQEIENFPYKNVITRALGIEEAVEVDVHEEPVKRNDGYLLCSDGLSNAVPNKDILKIVQKCGNRLTKVCRDLTDLANQAGGNDNVTTILIRIL